MTAVRLLQQDPEWADEAPYGTQLLNHIQELAGNVVPQEDQGEVDLLTEITKLYRGLLNTPKGTGSEAMAYYKTTTSVLKQLTELTAKAEEVAQYKEFKSKVFALFEHVLTPDQITDGIEFLKGARPGAARAT